MDKITIAEIENAFQPAKEIRTADRFAGRSAAVSDAHYALLAAGSNIAVLGNRGIGKTSLARQIANIASGDPALLDQLKIDHGEPFDFMTFYFACGHAVRSVDDLLARLLTNASCLSDWIYDIPKAKKLVSSLSPELKAEFFGIGAKLGGSTAEELGSERAIASHSVDTIFTNICAAIASEGLAKHGLLIVIDEFDQIQDPTGMAGLLKSMASNAPGVRFCLVGVARDIRNLMKEHESADRLFAGSIINLPPMSKEELLDIIRIAEDAVDRSIQFSEGGANRLVDLAQGHPYMVHLIGKYALRQAFQEHRSGITADDIDRTLNSMAQRQADPVLENRYLKAIASSPQREVVLRALAKTRNKENGESWTTDAYKVALERGVDNASQYVGHLVTSDYGAEIEKVRERYYRFKDSLFAAYVSARPSQYPSPPIRRDQ